MNITKQLALQYSLNPQTEQKSKEMNEVVLGMSNMIYDKNSEDFVYTLEQKAENLRNLKKYKEALEIYLKLKPMKIDLYGKVSREYAMLLNTIATMYEYDEDYKRAIQYYQMSKIVKIKLYGEDCP